MLPIAPLMIEHRLMDRMIGLIRSEALRISDGRVNIRFVDCALDFFRTYVDLCHHGKEEDILFRALGSKELLPEHKSIMEELLAEHASGRKIIAGLADARDFFLKGEGGASGDMREQMEKMLALYPSHIEKEDKHFFLPAMRYLMPEEQKTMLAEMNEFDRKLVHNLYRDMVEQLEMEGN